MTRRRTVAFGLVAAILAVFLGFVASRASAAHVEHAPLRLHGAVVICDGWAEDSAAHLHLIAFDHGQAIYRCGKKGY